MTSTYHFGRGKTGTLNDLKKPKEYHYNDTSYKEARKCGKQNTVGNRKTILKDVQRIKNGEAKSKTIDKKGSKTTRFTLNNGRTYGVGHNGTLYPEKGSKLQQLNKQQTRALGHLNDHGVSTKSQIALRRQRVCKADTNVAVNVWQQNKGQKVNPKTVKNWQTGLERNLPQKNTFKKQSISKKRGR